MADIKQDNNEPKVEAEIAKTNANEEFEEVIKTTNNSEAEMESFVEDESLGKTTDALPTAKYTSEDAAKLAAPAEACNLNIKTKGRSRKKLLVSLASVVFIAAVAAGAVWYFVINSQSKTDNNTPTYNSLLGAELTVVDGTAQIGAGDSWQDVLAGSQITQGAYLKTGADSRAIITLDDGSAIRLNSNATVKIDSLASYNVVIVNIAGEVYARVVKSDRIFAVQVANETFKAMGTAYKTVNTDELKGVEVYESTVRAVYKNIDIAEGNYYYDDSLDTSLRQKVASISADKVKTDEFLIWNYQQDKSANEFKDKLGYLKTVYETEPTPTPTPTPTQAQSTRGGITLSGSAYSTGVQLNWDLSNLAASKGFKVVMSSDVNPTYPEDYAQFVSADTRSYSWSIKDGKTYHFRVCLYTETGCTTYSNDISVTAPLVAMPAPTGDVTLISDGGVNFHWTISGTSPNGYKLVWSTSANPVYPSEHYQYYGSESTKSGAISETSGHFYVRVCLYSPGNGPVCPIYSNQLEITLGTL